MTRHQTLRTKKSAMERITLAEVRRLIDYDPSSGQMVWRVTRGSTVRPGDPVGRPQMSLLSSRFSTARVVHFYMTGEWPDGEMIFIDRNPDNYRWDNLQPVSASVKAIRSMNLHEGITKLPSGQYAVTVEAGGRTVSVGVYVSFKTAQEVHAACSLLITEITQC